MGDATNSVAAPGLDVVLSCHQNPVLAAKLLGLILVAASEPPVPLRRRRAQLAGREAPVTGGLSVAPPEIAQP